MSDLFISIEQAEGDLLAAAAFIGERIKSSDGHAEAMNAVVPRYLAIGNVDLAAELANAVDDPYSRDKLLILVAEQCAVIDDDEYALQLADAIEDQGLRAQAFERIALAMANKGNTEKAAEIAETMAHPDFVYSGIAVNQVTNGNEAAADKTLDAIEFPTARTNALQMIAAGYIESGKPEKAAAALERAVEAAVEIEHDEEKIRAISEIGSLFLGAGRKDKAIETFDQAVRFAEMLENIHRDYFLVSSAIGFLHAGSIDLADRTLDLVTDKTQMASALTGFAREYWKSDQKDDAIETLEEAYSIIKSQREAETRDSRARNALMATIAAQFAGFGKTDRGVEIALENQDPAEETAALSQIAQILTSQKEDELTRQTLTLIVEDANRLFALVAVSDAKEKLGERDAAAALLNEAAVLSETVPQLGSRSEVLNEIAARYADFGDTGRAREISGENFKVIAEIRDESSRSASLAKLWAVYKNAGLDLNDAEKVSLAGIIRR